MTFLALAACLWSASSLAAADSAAPPSPADIEFFEKHVRPILTEHCYKCHAHDAQKLKGGLMLDSRQGLLNGGDSGPALVPGDPAKSLLITAVGYANDDLQMPPKSKLRDEQIAALIRWIKMGAPDPRVTAAAPPAKAIDIEAGRKHWAYQPVTRPAVPAVKNAAWPRGDIDRFILASLETRGLAPTRDADRRTFIRRLYFDLVGLPPSPQEIDAFVNDPAPDATDKLVDRLLASRHFGERWARHWFDIARFAESLTLRGFILKDAWRYRDYVIDAFNTDRPYDVFIREQIAGDLLPTDDLALRQRQMIATTFLTMGNNNLEEQDKKLLVMDAVDEQMDVIGKGILAQTITCARCHDHKFDPIPTRDYYAIAGILKNSRMLEHANVSKWIEVKLPVDPRDEARYREHETHVAAVQDRIKSVKAVLAKVSKASAPVVAARDLPGIVVDDAQARQVGAWKQSTNSKQYIGSGYLQDQNADKGQKTLTFTPDLPRDGNYEVRLAYVPGAGRANRVPVTVFSAEGEVELLIDMTAAPPLEGRWVSLGQYRFEKSGQSYVIVSNENTSGYVIADAVQFLPITAAMRLATSDAGKPEPSADAMSAQLTELEADLKKLQKHGLRRPTIIGVVEEENIEDLAIHVRGNPGNLGPVVPRGFMQVASYGPQPPIPDNQSGRRELADWLASPHNPLTARVIVNRLWHWTVGAGLVRTADNFGTTGETPSHPELLDYLAESFMRRGWSIKTLLRHIVLSRTYQLASTTPPQATQLDPENRLLSHAHRRRLDAEAIRDTMLAVSGQLDLDAPAGPGYAPTLAADYSFVLTDTRRSVYAPVFRNALPELLEVFDFADPSAVTGVRNVSTVAPQALFLMNHPFVMQQAEHAAARLLADDTAGEDTALLRRAYAWALGRSPSPREAELALAYLHSESPSSDPTLRRLAFSRLFQALFASIDFRYVQ